MQVIDYLKNMSAERFLAIYQSLENQGFGPLDGEVAKILKFRPQAIRKLPMDQRARRAKSFLERGSSADLAYELFGTYLLKNHKGIVTGFLDATGVEHDEGMIDDLDATPPDAKKVDEAIAGLDKEFESDDVTLYLAMCAEQWPQVDAIQKAYDGRAAKA